MRGSRGGKPGSCSESVNCTRDQAADLHSDFKAEVVSLLTESFLAQGLKRDLWLYGSVTFCQLCCEEVSSGSRSRNRRKWQSCSSCLLTRGELPERPSSRPVAFVWRPQAPRMLLEKRRMSAAAARHES